MDELVVYQKTVELAPLEDVAKFMLIAPEKAKAQAAEIRAMRNLGVAQEVLAQKEEEQRMLNELILDAGSRIGELTREIPKSVGGRPLKETCANGATSFEQKPKTKEQIGAELGFTRHDMSRFEKLADNKDLIEEEKVSAREENRMPTRTNVLAKARERDKGTKTRKNNGQYLVPGGFSQEERKSREQIANACRTLYDKNTASQFDLDSLLKMIEVNGTKSCSVLKQLLEQWKHLFESDDEKKVIEEAINNYYWRNIVALKGEFNL